MERLKNFLENFFCGDRLKSFCEDLFFLESTCTCVLGPRPWPRAFLSLASRVCLSSERLSLALASDFFVSLALASDFFVSLALASDFFVSLALASCLVSSTPPLVNGFCRKVRQLSNLDIKTKVNNPALRQITHTIGTRTVRQKSK